LHFRILLIALTAFIKLFKALHPLDNFPSIWVRDVYTLPIRFLSEFYPGSIRISDSQRLNPDRTRIGKGYPSACQQICKG
jgi:hypothetical protein